MTSLRMRVIPNGRAKSLGEIKTRVTTARQWLIASLATVEKLEVDRGDLPEEPQP